MFHNLKLNGTDRLTKDQRSALDVFGKKRERIQRRIDVLPPHLQVQAKLKGNQITNYNACKCGRNLKWRRAQICSECRSEKSIAIAQIDMLKALWDTGSVKDASLKTSVHPKTCEWRLAALRKHIGMPQASLLELIKWGVRSGILYCLCFFLGCSSPQPAAPVIKPAQLPPQTVTTNMPPGEAAYAIAMANAKPQGIIVLPVSPPGSGVTSGAGTYPFKTTITITATPSTGYVFSQWSDGNISTPRSLIVPKGSTTLTAFFALLSPPPSHTNSVTLAWNPGAGCVVYRLYWGPASGSYTNFTVSASTAGTVYPVVVGSGYFFAVKGYNSIGIESPFSNEVSFTP